MATVTLTELLGAPVFDSSGQPTGRVREVAISPQEDRAKESVLVIKTNVCDLLLPFSSVVSIYGGIRALSAASGWS